MSFVEDVTIGEGESVPPDTQFTKTWRIQNTGETNMLVYVSLVSLVCPITKTKSADINMRFGWNGAVLYLNACVFLQVQSRGRRVWVWSTSEEISLVTWTWWWCALWSRRRSLKSACRCAVQPFPACIRVSGECVRPLDSSTEVRRPLLFFKLIYC